MQHIFSRLHYLRDWLSLFWYPGWDCYWGYQQRKGCLLVVSPDASSLLQVCNSYFIQCLQPWLGFSADLQFFLCPWSVILNRYAVVLCASKCIFISVFVWFSIHWTDIVDAAGAVYCFISKNTKMTFKITEWHKPPFSAETPQKKKLSIFMIKVLPANPSPLFSAIISVLGCLWYHHRHCCPPQQSFSVNMPVSMQTKHIDGKGLKKNGSCRIPESNLILQENKQHSFPQTVMVQSS